MNKIDMKRENEEQSKADPMKIGMIERDSRIIYLNDPIDKESAYKTNRTLLLLDEISNEPIKIFINSPGGEVNSGFFIFDCIKFIRSPVYVIGVGLVASAATFIYLSVEKKYRLSLPHARYMLHQPLSGSRGVVTDLEIHAKEAEDLKKLINGIVSEATGTKLKKVEEDTDRDFWLNAEEAKKYGIVDTIITNKDDFKELFPVPNYTKDKKKAKKTASKTSNKTPANSTTKTTSTKKGSSTTKSDTKKTSKK